MELEFVNFFGKNNRFKKYILQCKYLPFTNRKSLTVIKYFDWTCSVKQYATPIKFLFSEQLFWNRIITCWNCFHVMSIYSHKNVEGPVTRIKRLSSNRFGGHLEVMTVQTTATRRGCPTFLVKNISRLTHLYTWKIVLYETIE